MFQLWKYAPCYISVLKVTTILCFSFESIHHVIIQFWKCPPCYVSVFKVSTMLYFCFECIHHVIIQFWKYPTCYISVLKVSTTLNWLIYFFMAQQPQSGLGRLVFEVFRSHTVGRNPLNEWSARRRGRYLHDKQKQKTNIHAVSGIRTRNPNSRAAEHLKLRLHGHRVRW